MLERAMSGDDFGELLVSAIERDEEIVVTGIEDRAELEAWHKRIMQAFDNLGTRSAGA
jgi:hypothetical protein